MGALLAILMPMLVPLITPLVLKFEGLFGAKGQGPVRADLTTSVLQVITNTLAAKGEIPAVPDEAMLRTMIETVVQSLKAQGQLGGTSVLPVLAAGSRYIMTLQPTT